MVAIPDAGIATVITVFIFTGLAFIIVGLRVGTRLFIAKNFRSADTLVVVAMGLSICFLAAIMYQFQYGLGTEISLQQLSRFLQAVYVTVILYHASLSICKLSIIVQCCCIFRKSARNFLRVFLAGLVFVSTWLVCSSIFICWPIELNWNSAPQAPGNCMDRSVVTFTNAGITIVTDLLLAVIPLVLLRDLHMARNEKMILLGVFGASLFATSASGIRLSVLYTISQAEPSQQSMLGLSIALWSSVEINTAIACASVPALGPLAARFAPKLLCTSNWDQGQTYHSTRIRTGRRFLSSRDEVPAVSQNATITLETTFEQLSLPRGYGDGRISYDGSENALVFAECSAASREGSTKDEEDQTPTFNPSRTIKTAL